MATATGVTGKPIQTVEALLNQLIAVLTEIKRESEEWETRSFVNMKLNLPIAVSGPGLLGGVEILGGAATATVKIYDQDNPSAIVEDSRLKWVEKGLAGALSKQTSLKIRMRRNIVFQVDQSDAIVIIMFKPDASKFRE